MFPAQTRLPEVLTGDLTCLGPDIAPQDDKATRQDRPFLRRLRLVYKEIISAIKIHLRVQTAYKTDANRTNAKICADASVLVMRMRKDATPIQPQAREFGHAKELGGIGGCF